MQMFSTFWRAWRVIGLLVVGRRYALQATTPTYCTAATYEGDVADDRQNGRRC